MKLAVICANGREGSLIVREALARGLDVTAVVRGENRSAAEKVIVKDLFDLTAEDLAGFDVVVDACGGWTPETIPAIPAAVKHLCGLLRGSGTRLVIVGGAGSLFVDAAHTVSVADGPDFPDAFKPLAAAHAEALDYLREQRDVRWTYISPAADFQADGAHRRLHARRRGADAERKGREHDQLRGFRDRDGGRGGFRRPRRRAYQRGQQVNWFLEVSYDTGGTAALSYRAAAG